jgi:hypothetical protein
MFAQDAADKTFQAGLVTGFGVNFQKMGTTKINTNGLGNDLTIGMNMNFSFNETIGLTTGLEFDFETLKYVTAGENFYYRYDDKLILNNSEAASSNSDQLFMVSERKQKPVYLSIPTMLLFRTKYIGYFRYFGKFGLRNSFLLSNKITDVGYDFEFDVNPVVEQALGQTTSSTNEDMKAPGEMLFVKSAVGLAGGAEWNFTGTTCLVAELGYYYGFTPLHLNKKDDKAFLFHTDDLGTTDSYFSNQATQGQLMFKLSILF